MVLCITMQSRKGAQGLSPGVGSSNDSPSSAPHRFAEWPKDDSLSSSAT